MEQRQGVKSQWGKTDVWFFAIAVALIQAAVSGAELELAWTLENGKVEREIVPLARLNYLGSRSTRATGAVTSYFFPPARQRIPVTDESQSGPLIHTATRPADATSRTVT